MQVNRGKGRPGGRKQEERDEYLCGKDIMHI